MSWWVVLHWQLAALLLSATALASQLLVRRAVAVPAAQSLLNYALLAMHYAHPAARTPQQQQPSASALPDHTKKTDARQWPLLALIDVEANYLLVMSYRYTDITSVTLLDAFTVPCVVLLSHRLLGARYSARQLFAVALSLCGLGVLVGVDFVARPNRAHYERPWLGDGLVLVGSALYALSNVAEEALVRTSRAYYFARIGGYGFVFCAANCLLFEREAIATAWSETRSAPAGQQAEVAGLMVGYTASLFCFYLLVGHLLSRGSTALLMNLSLITADFWSVLAGVLLLGSRLSMPWYPLAFCTVVAGLLLYHSESERSPARRSSGLTEPLTSSAAVTAAPAPLGAQPLRQGAEGAGQAVRFGAA